MKENSQFKFHHWNGKDSESILTWSKYNEYEKYIQHTEKWIRIIQDLKYKIQKVPINEDGVNTLDEGISITEEKMT